MDKKNFFVEDGSSGIGLEIIKKLKDNQNEIFVGSRTLQSLTDDPEIHHLQLDVTEDFSDFEGLPDIVHGPVYHPGYDPARQYHISRLSAGHVNAMATAQSDFMSHSNFLYCEFARPAPFSSSLTR